MDASGTSSYLGIITLAYVMKLHYDEQDLEIVETSITGFGRQSMHLLGTKKLTI